VSVPEHADCLRYYASSGVGQGSQVLIYLDGDVLKGSPGHVSTIASYAEKSPASLMNQVEREQGELGIPVIYLARPGTMGSSGNQNDRRQRGETQEINAAIDQLKARFRWTDLGLSGQSGGGGLVAALIAERSDIHCAVASSGVTAVKLRARAKGADPTGTPENLLWDPIEQLARVHVQAGFRMFVASDTEDSEVPYFSQAAYVDAARADGLDITQIQMHAAGAEHHGLANSGLAIAAQCMHGVATQEIVRLNQGQSESARKERS
jgi:dienelactone hydrolase